MFWKNDNSKAAEDVVDMDKQIEEYEARRQAAAQELVAAANCVRQPSAQEQLDDLKRQLRELRGDFNLMLEYYGKEVEQVPQQKSFRRLVERGSVKGGPERDDSRS